MLQTYNYSTAVPSAYKQLFVFGMGSCPLHMPVSAEMQAVREADAQTSAEPDPWSEDPADQYGRSRSDMEARALGSTDPAAATASTFVPLGKANLRQWTCAIGKCQHWQQLLLYGCDTQHKLSTDPMVLLHNKNRRRAENARKNNSLVDAAASKPEITDPEKLQELLDHYGGRLSRREQLAGLKGGAMYIYTKCGMARGEQVRNLRECQILNYDFPPIPDIKMSQQTMEVLAFSQDVGKMSVGDRTNYAAATKHRDVSYTLV